MPKETFFNLPEEKRSLICEVAVNEFAEYSFENASINRIVAASGIAKGSFYQYFQDKSDLFLYLLQMAAAEKSNFISPLLTNPEKLGFYTLLREIYLSGMRFAAAHPKYAEMGRRLMENQGSPIYQQVMADSLPAAQHLFEALLERAAANGEIRADIDTKMFAHLMAAMNNVVIQYHTDCVSQSYDELMIATVDKFLAFVRHGFGPAASQADAPRAEAAAASTSPLPFG